VEKPYGIKYECDSGFLNLGEGIRSQKKNFAQNPFHRARNEHFGSSVTEEYSASS
jgi:hypothetical protein